MSGSQHLGGPAVGVLLLSADDSALMQQLVTAFNAEYAHFTSPQSGVQTADSSTPLIAVFVYADNTPGAPHAWKWIDPDGISYDAPAAFRLLGFVTVY